MKSPLFTLGLNDTVRSLVSAAFAAGFTAVLLAVGSVANTTGFDVFSADWIVIGKMVVNVFFITFVGRILEKFVSRPDGKVAGLEALYPDEKK